MVFQLERQAATYVAINTGELLPHLLTLTFPKKGGYFLLPSYTLSSIFPLRSVAFCAARTFL